MAEKKVIELEIKTDSVQSLKAQLREAQADVAALSEKFGATSQEAINAAKRAAELKDAIGDAKALTDAYNPDAKFNALSASIGGVLNGFQAFQGALGLVGVESKDVEEALLKVNSAMALAQGVSGVMESIDSFKTLGKQISNLTVVQKLSTAAQKLWNLAMNANPLGVIILSITALIAAGYKLISFFQDSAEENERMAKSVAKNEAALKRQQIQIEKSSSKQKDYNNFQYEYAKASGASAEQLRKLAIKHQEEELALANKNRELAKSTYLRQQDILSTMMAKDADEELIEKQKEVVKQARESATKTREVAAQENKDLIALKRAQIVEIRQEQLEADKKEREDAAEAAKKRKEAANEAAKDAAQKRKELRDKEAQERLKAAEEQAKFEEEQITLEEKRAEQAWQRKQEEHAKMLEEELALEEAARQRREEAEAAEEQRQIEAFEREKELRLRNKEFAFQAAEDTFSFINNLASQTQQKYEALNKAVLDNDKLTDKEKQKLLDANNKRAKKAFEVQKAVSIASALVATYQSAVSAYQSQFLPLPDPSSPIRGAIAAGLAVAAGLVNVKNIASQKFEGASLTPSSGSAGGSVPDGAGSTSAIAPNFNIVGNAQATNPLAGLGGQPLQAYVVSGEVTTAQSLDRNRVNYATFG